MFHSSRSSVMYHLAAHRRRDHNLSRFAIFPIRNANFVQIENQFSCTLLAYLVQEHSRYLQTLLFLKDILGGRSHRDGEE
jgi:hypothetical protein